MPFSIPTTATSIQSIAVREKQLTTAFMLRVRVNLSTVGKESFYVAASRAKHEFKIYTASTKALGLSIEQSRGQENALNLIMKQKLDRQLSTIPTREQEFKLLVSAKYLVESQGVLDPNHPPLKSYKSLDGTEIKRDKNSLTITQQGKELVFNRDNSTAKNTFTATK